MSNSTTLLDTISSTQSNKEASANALFDAASPAMIFGRRASTTAGLVWGYYGGALVSTSNVVTQVPNGTVNLTASATNYVQADTSTGAVSVSTSGFTLGMKPLYQIVTGTTTVTSYTDCRIGGGSAGADTLSELTDVAISSPADGQLMVYSAAQGKWANATFASIFAAWFNGLPTTLPSSSGAFWNNGGTLSKS